MNSSGVISAYCCKLRLPIARAFHEPERLSENANVATIALLSDIRVYQSTFTDDKHTVFASATGARVALLSHSSLRDSAATQVSVKQGCCRRFIAYEYFGDGDDYMDGRSVTWIDDHHLVIRFAVDPTGQQKCHPYAGDVIVSCEPYPDPTVQPNR